MRLDRINDMERYIQDQGTVSLEALAKHFQISLNTVRRDINELQKRGTLDKVYGGVSAKKKEEAVPFTIRKSKNSLQKQTIGRLAAELVSDGDTIFLDSGSTTVCLLPHISQKNNLTVVTHSLTVMYEASKYPSLQVIALGGLFHPTTSSYVGFSTLEALSRLSLTTIFIAATGVSLDAGLTNTTYFEAEIKRAVTSRSNKIVLMADSSKFGYASTITFFDFNRLYAVVTEKPPAQEYLEAIHKNNTKLLCEYSG